MKTKVTDVNDDVHVYHSRERLTERLVGAETGGLPPEGTVEELPTLLYRLLEIPGVVSAEVHVYHISVLKGVMFEWDEIEPTVLALMDCFNAGTSEQMLNEDDCTPVEMGEGYTLVFQRSKSNPALVRAALKFQGELVWKDEPISHTEFSREQHLARVRALLPPLPQGVTL